MPTFIDGIAASENIDSSGERISIAGLDISSLDKDGLFNWEHKKDEPSQIVGKILKAKKIFAEEDCEDDRQAYYWSKCQTPFVYVMGELFDDYKDSAKEVAGMFRYDADRKGQNERNVMNFSIEGAKIHKEGIEITRSIGRKVTITVLPCNKVAVAEMVPADNGKQKNDIDSLFKTEPGFEIELFKQEGKAAVVPAPKDLTKHAEKLGIEPMNKAVIPFKKPLTTAPGQTAKVPPTSGDTTAKIPSQTTNPGKEMGKTKSGKSIFTHARIHEYHGFSSGDHREAASFHHSAAQKAGDPAVAMHHFNKMKLHMQAAGSAERKEGRFAAGRTQAANRALGKNEPLEKTIRNKNPNWPKGVHPEYDTPGTHEKGISHAGLAIRHGHPDYAKKEHKRVLSELKSDKKPNLPKSENAPSTLAKAKIDEGKDVRGKTVARSNRRNEIPENYTLPTRAGGHLKNGDVVSAKLNHEQSLARMKSMPKPKLEKALSAGSGMSAPSAKTGGEALAKEDASAKSAKRYSEMSKPLGNQTAGKDMKYPHQKTSMGQSHQGFKVRNPEQAGAFSAKEIAQKRLKHLQNSPKPKLDKTEWLARAEEAYASWGKREEFRAFMQKRLPNLAMGEIDAIGKTIALKRSIDAEKKLSKLIKK